MPTYEYACRSCDERLEVVQSFQDEPLTTCPRCGGQLRKVFGAIGIAFKGSGFYRTDNRAGAGERPRAGEKKADTAGDGAAGATEAKPGSAASKPDSPTPASTGTSTSDPKAAASS